MAKDAVTLTHPERVKRRASIAAAIKRGESLSAVAKRFSVTVQTVRAACIEHGVPCSLRS